ncbi:MAG: YkgJ family cysteine cluster protein [Lentisphaeria bacterium]|nr:YkgJ family cysteine cluster protein [Lentisphaeria bacterium]
MARTPEDKLTVANQHFRCTDCGRCCRDWYVALLPDDKRRLSKLQWRREDGVPEKFIATVNKKEYVAHRSDGTCIYFDRAAGNCMIHARHSEIIKPLGCRVYPFNIVAALDGEQSVMARYDCPAVRAGTGQPLSQSKRQIGRYIEELCIGDGFDCYDREGLDVDAIRKIVAGVYKLVIDSPALDCPAAVTAASIAVYRLEQLGTDFLNDVNPNSFSNPSFGGRLPTVSKCRRRSMSTTLSAGGSWCCSPPTCDVTNHWWGRASGVGRGGPGRSCG